MAPPGVESSPEVERKRSASRAAIAPDPADVMACRYTWSETGAKKKKTRQDVKQDKIKGQKVKRLK